MSLSSQRKLSPRDLEEDEHAFLQEHSIDIGAQSGTTPSSVLLAPIQERVTSRRRRKRRVPGSTQPFGFPQPIKEENVPSTFARDFAKVQSALLDGPSTQSATDVDLKLQSMSQSERENLLKMYTGTCPEYVSFVRKKKGIHSSSESASGVPMSLEDEMGVDMDIRPEGTSSRSARDAVMMEADALSAELSKMKLEKQTSVDSSEQGTHPARRTVAQKIGEESMEREGTASDHVLCRDNASGNISKHDSVQEGISKSPYLVSQGVAEESDKLEWTRDGTANSTSDQQNMEAAMEKCVAELGEIGQRRFDLQGKMLTPEQVKNLPTHLGLHHHGMNPADAGYTLTEILLLTRSTVTTQRAIAFLVFARLINEQTDLIMQSLLKSGALTLVFSSLNHVKSTAINPAAALAELSAAEAVLKTSHDTGLREMTEDVYFASLFYSPCAVRGTTPVVHALQSSDLVPTLITLAHMWFRSEKFDLCTRALFAARAVVSSCTVVAGKALLLKLGLPHLQEMATTSGMIVSTLVPFLACNVLSFYVLFAGWTTADASEEALGLLQDKTLKQIGHCMYFYLKLPQDIGDEAHLASAASLRVFRGALTFDKGINMFRNNLPAICAVSFAHGSSSGVDDSSPSWIASREGLLALEAYVHALFSTLSRLQIEIEEGSALSSTQKAADNMKDLKREKESVHAQISSLVPLAQSAINVFLQGGFSLLQAAAGHFAGSVISLLREPIPSNVAPLILQMAKKCSKIVSNESSRGISPKVELMKFQRVASCAHAAGRILARSVLPESVVGQICCELISGAEIEKQFCSRESQSFICPAANAAAEWLVKFAQLRPNREAVFRAVQLIPLMAEPQGIIELLCKCIVYPPLLECLNPKITRTLGRQIVDKLSPPTLSKLLDVQGTLSKQVRKSKGLLATFADIVQWWLCAPETTEHGALVAGALVQSDLISPGVAYRAICLVPPMAFVQGSAFSELVFESGTKIYLGNSLAFHPYCNTTLSFHSEEKRPALVESFISYADHLANRGPFACDTGASSGDALASVVLTMICRRDSHVSLRQRLWQLSVLDCGGAALFGSANLLGGMQSIEGEDDEDVVVGLYCQAIANGLLYGARCPRVLQQIICARLCARLRKESNLHTMQPLVSCHSQGHMEPINTLVEWLNEWRSDEEMSLFRSFLSR